MMANAAYHFCLHHKIFLFGLINADSSKSFVDEALSYVFAGLGFYVQFKSGFSLPSPLNLVLWPLGEYLLWHCLCLLEVAKVLSIMLTLPAFVSVRTAELGEYYIRWTITKKSA